MFKQHRLSFHTYWMVGSLCVGALFGLMTILLFGRTVSFGNLLWGLIAGVFMGAVFASSYNQQMRHSTS